MKIKDIQCICGYDDLFFADKDEKNLRMKEKSGHWIPTPYELEYQTDAKCSLCDAWIVDGIRYYYCPICGARMIREDDKK